MLRRCLFAAGVCLSATTGALADTPATPVLTDDAARFDAFFKMAERARAAGQYDQAAIAYKAALDIQVHPVISGRLGLVLMKLGQLDRAAEELHEAVERGQGVSAQERREVGAAYDKAKGLTTWVHVHISHAGAKVTVDGNSRNRAGFSSFWMFAMPGEHTIRATLEGYGEAVATFTAKPGDEITVPLKLVPLPTAKLPQLPAASAKSPDVARKFPPILRSSNIATDPNYSTKEDPFYETPKPPKPPENRGPRFSVMGGVVTVFGVASWNPAVGGVLGVGLRPHDNFSIGLEGRAAWLTMGVAGEPIGATAAGGIFSACAHVKWFFGCALGYAGAMRISFSEDTFTGGTAWRPSLGGGGRVGARLGLSRSFSLAGTCDALGLNRRAVIILEDKVLADQPPFMLGVQLNGVWEF